MSGGRAVLPTAALALALVTPACGEAPLTAGADQPLRVESGQFHEGALPGLPPLGNDQINAGVAPLTPNVTSLDITGLSIIAGESEKTIRGRTSTDASAVALRFAESGSGYWVVPVGGPDPVNGGEYTFSLLANVSRDTRPGYHSLLFAGIGEDGRAGNQGIFRLCVGSPVPDNLNACEPTRAPPALVISLSWDTDVDLDLQLLTPDGKLVDAKHPTTDLATTDHKPDPEAPGVGVLDRDSNAGCQLDSLRRENLVFATQPAPGRYRVHASLFQACGETSAHFTVSLHSQASGTEPDTFVQVVSAEKRGVLLAAQADGGSKLGLFVTEFVVE